MTLDEIFGLYNYWVVICLMMTGFYIVIARKNLIKTVIGLNVFQTSVVLLYITMGKVTGGTAPIIPPEIAAQHGEHHEHSTAHSTAHMTADAPHLDHATEHGHEAVTPLTQHADHVHQTASAMADHSTELIYSNPLPSVLMLTAIVVGIATTALALALIVRISEDYGTIEEDEILLIDQRDSSH